MTPADLAQTHKAAFPDAPWSADAIAGLLAQDNVLVIGDPLSFLIGRLTVDEAEILTLATHPASHRNGHAKRRLEMFEQEVRHRGATTMFLEVAADNIAARALYVRAGFNQAGIRPKYYRRPNQTPVDALILRKNLAKTEF